MMVLKYHKPELEVNRVLEFKAWIYAQLFPFGMTDAFGLAGFAAGKEFGALVVKEEKEMNLTVRDGAMKRLVNAMLPIFRFNYDRIRADALRRGVKEIHSKISVETIERFVEDGRPPIVMVDQTGYAPSDDYRYGILHWVVVTGFNTESVKINDPDIGPSIVVSKPDFEKSLDLRRNFGTDRRIVVVNPLSAI